MSSTNHNRSLLSRCGNWVLNHPLAVLLIVAILTFFAGRYAASHLSIDTDTQDMIAPDAPFQQNRRHFEKAFAQDMHTLLLVIESDTPELTKAATKRLGRLLNADKTHFDSVYIPSENDFFHQNGLLYLNPTDLLALPTPPRRCSRPVRTRFPSICGSVCRPPPARPWPIIRVPQPTRCHCSPC